MTFSTEDLLTSPAVFGLATASNVQRAWCRALDGVPIGDLANDPDVIRAFGGTIPDPVRAREALLILAIRSAKSMTAAAKAIEWSQTVDVSACSASDIVQIFVVGLKLSGTRQVMSHVLTAVKKPALRRLVIGEPSTNMIVLRHPTGRPIEIAPTVLDRAGGSATSVWCAGAIVDEAPRALGEDDAVRNLDHFTQTVLGRLLPNAQLLEIGSPFAASGPIYETVTQRWGRPGRDVLVVRAPGPIANPSWWTTERCAELREKKPQAYETDVLGNFGATELDAFDHEQVLACFKRQPSPDAYFHPPTAVIDVADLRPGVGDDYYGSLWSYAYGDAPALDNDRPRKVQRVWNDREGRYDEKLLVQGDNSEWLPVVPPQTPPPMLCCLWMGAVPRGLRQDDAVAWLATQFTRHTPFDEDYGRLRVQRVVGDQRDSTSQEALWRRVAGLRFHEQRWTGSADGSKTRAVRHARALMADGALSLIEHEKLRTHLLQYRMSYSRSGQVRWEGAGRHDDAAQCALTAMMADEARLIDGSPIRPLNIRHEEYA